MLKKYPFSFSQVFLESSNLFISSSISKPVLYEDGVPAKLRTAWTAPFGLFEVEGPLDSTSANCSSGRTPQHLVERCGKSNTVRL